MVAVICALVVGATGAVAAQLITGKDIKNNTIAAKDLKKKLRNKIGQSGTAGSPGQTGPQGPEGPAGPAAQATYTNPQWGVMDRNTQGSPQVDLRGGPFAGITQEPPFGDGSLGLSVEGDASRPDGQRRRAGDLREVDFVGDTVASIDELGFQVYTTGENNGRGNPNMPLIKIEIDPNLSSTASGFSTLTFQPSNTTANQWSPYIDATTAPASAAGNGLFLSGAAGTSTGCALATPCTFAQLQTALNDGGDAATIFTVAVGKGRDFAWSGAVDGLRVNNTIYDFEPFGVVETPAS